MTLAEKPPLNEELLVHFGVRGMRWGVRRDRAQAQIKTAVGNISTETKVKATIAAGSAATIGILYATGNLKAASVGTGKLALSGAKAGGAVLLKASGMAIKGAFVGTKFVLGGAAKLTGKALGGSFRAVFGSGKTAVEATVQKSGKRSLRSLLRFRRRGEGPAQKILKKTGGRTLRSLLRMKPKAVKPPIKLYPTASLLRDGKAPAKLFPTKSILDSRKKESSGGLMRLATKWRPADADG